MQTAAVGVLFLGSVYYIGKKSMDAQKTPPQYTKKTFHDLAASRSSALDFQNQTVLPHDLPGDVYQDIDVPVPGERRWHMTQQAPFDAPPRF